MHSQFGGNGSHLAHHRGIIGRGVGKLIRVQTFSLVLVLATSVGFPFARCCTIESIIRFTLPGI
jgi:hypothetical protein